MNQVGKTALVTGGSRGIGREIALTLAGSCDKVAILFAGRRDAAEETVKALEQKGVKALAIQCDVSDEAQVSSAVSKVREAFGAIDILVNNAGITRDMLTLRMSAEEFARVIAVNLNGAFHLIKACYRDFLKLGWGRIVNIRGNDLSCNGLNRLHQPQGSPRNGRHPHPHALQQGWEGGLSGGLY